MLFLLLTIVSIGCIFHVQKIKRVPNHLLKHYQSELRTSYTKYCVKPPSDLSVVDDSCYADFNKYDPFILNDVSYFFFSPTVPPSLTDNRIIGCTDTPGNHFFRSLLSGSRRGINYVGLLDNDTSLHGSNVGLRLWSYLSTKFTRRAKRTGSEKAVLFNHITKFPVVEAGDSFITFGPLRMLNDERGRKLQGKTYNKIMDPRSHKLRQVIDDEMLQTKSRKLLQLYTSSYGVMSPCYFGNKTIHRWLTKWHFYIFVLIGWSHSLFSPLPVTLVHFPRLLVYTGIAVYRYLVLYLLSNFVEKKITNSLYDFSDHIVIVMMAILFISLEVVVADRSSRLTAIKDTINDKALQITSTNGDREKMQIVNQHEEIYGSESRSQLEVQMDVMQMRRKLNHDRISGMNMQCSINSDECRLDGKEQTALQSSEKPSLHLEASKLSASPLSTESGKHQKHREFFQMGAWAPNCVRVYAFVTCGVMFYYIFYTAVFFHSFSEMIVGYMVGFVGLFVAFWVTAKYGGLKLVYIGIVDNDS